MIPATQCSDMISKVLQSPYHPSKLYIYSVTVCPLYKEAEVEYYGVTRSETFRNWQTKIKQKTTMTVDSIVVVAP